ncbi:MAG TPA: hypothetical protein V6C76_15400 [Drouetiella sp.]
MTKYDDLQRRLDEARRVREEARKNLENADELVNRLNEKFKLLKIKKNPVDGDGKVE